MLDVAPAGVSSEARAAIAQQPLELEPAATGLSPQRDSLRRPITTLAVNPKTLAPRVRDELRAIDPALAVLKIDTVDEQLNDVLAQDRLLAVLAAFFGGMGVLLSSLGLYGLIAQMMSRRTSEIAVRIALGATRLDVLWIVLREGLRTIVIGVAIGIPIALGAAKLIAPQLFGVRPGDPLILAAATLTMTAVASGAALIPARRAAALDPLAALRDG